MANRQIRTLVFVGLPPRLVGRSQVRRQHHVGAVGRNPPRSDQAQRVGWLRTRNGQGSQPRTFQRIGPRRPAIQWLGPGSGPQRGQAHRSTVRRTPRQSAPKRLSIAGEGFAAMGDRGFADRRRTAMAANGDEVLEAAPVLRHADTDARSPRGLRGAEHSPCQRRA